ncbi:MAG: glycosyltransferase family 39 protein [Anaerolineae bacterium]
MPLGQRRTTLAILLLAIALALLGQIYLSRQASSPWDGLALYGLATVLFWVGMARAGEGQAVAGIARRAQPRLLLGAIGAAMVVYVATQAGNRGGRSGLELLLGWTIGIALVVAAFVHTPALTADLRKLWRKLSHPGPEVVFVAAMALATWLLRVYRLGDYPRVLSGDEASMGLEAVAVITGGRTNPFETGWLSHPTLYFFLQSLFVRLMGQTVAALRMSSTLVAVPTVVLLYLLARRLYGRWVAVLAAVFFAGYHYAIHFGRIGLNNIWDPFLALGTFFFLVRGLDDERGNDLLWSGLFLGMSVYFYMGARLIPVIAVLYVFYRAWRTPGLLQRQGPRLLSMALVAGLVALPLLLFFAARPQDMMARWSQIGIFPSGWVQAQQEATGRSAFSIVVGQFLRAALAFHQTTDPTYFYRPGIPLLHMAPAVLSVFGLGACLWRWREPRYLLPVVWFLAVIVCGGALLENPPNSPRLVLSIPAVVLFVVLGVSSLAELLTRVAAQPRAVGQVLSLGLVLALSVHSADFYLRVYSPHSPYAGLNTVVADRMGRYLHELGSSYDCYFLGAPRMYVGHATIPYLAQGVPLYDVEETLTDEPPALAHGRNAVFVIVPERLAELQVVKDRYPGGQLSTHYDESEELFVAYEVTQP